jgi:hypothetical protein
MNHGTAAKATGAPRPAGETSAPGRGETGRLHVRSVWGTEPTGEKGPFVGELGAPLRFWESKWGWYVGKQSGDFCMPEVAKMHATLGNQL